jgi:hypothetical protein
MFHDTGQPPFTESDREGLDFPCARGAGGNGTDSRPGVHGLPSFVSSAPPRSEGEALLRRIFLRGEAA